MTPEESMESSPAPSMPDLRDDRLYLFGYFPLPTLRSLLDAPLLTRSFSANWLRYYFIPPSGNSGKVSTLLSASNAMYYLWVSLFILFMCLRIHRNKYNMNMTARFHSQQGQQVQESLLRAQ